MNYISITTGLLCCLTIVGCSSTRYTPMTQQLREQENLTADELEAMQYVICPGLELRYNAIIDDNHVDKGVLYQRDGTLQEEVDIASWSPAIALHTTDNLVAASLERGHALPFGVEPDATSGRYLLQGRMHDGQFEAFYGGHWYQVLPKANSECQQETLSTPQLWVNTEELLDIIEERRELQGRYVPGAEPEPVQPETRNRTTD